MEYLAGKFTCREVAEIVTDYLEGAMPWWDQLRFHLHLGLCRGCRNYLKQMKETFIPWENFRPRRFLKKYDRK